MSLFSITFILFLMVTAAVYFSVPKKLQWGILLAASYAFYMWPDPRIAGYLLCATAITYLVGRWLQKENDRQADEILAKKTGKKEIKKRYTKRKRKILAVGLTAVFAILAVVKYSNFVIENINSLMASSDAGFRLGFWQIALPLGISFYTFQSAGYLIDVYRGKVTADRNFFRYALFVSYFPQIIQGPIGRHKHLAHQLFEEHSFEYRRVKFGAQRILWGFIKKMVIADRIAVIVDQVFGHFYDNGYAGVTVFLAVFLYSVQIYADFSGGMDIVCGVSQIFGIELAENFKRPFLAKSVSEFWQRWHITLGAWMRDYLFYPLALSAPFAKMGKKLRKVFGTYAGKVFPTCLASFIVFVLIGLWHGANWKYVVYGLYSAVFVSTGTLLEPLYARLRRLFHADPEKFSFRTFQILRTVFLVTVGRYFSRAESLPQALDMLRATFSVRNPWVLFDGSLLELGLDPKNFTLMILLIVFLFVIDLFAEKGVHYRECLERQGIVFRWIVYILAVFALLIFGMYGPGYDSASFIYQGF